MEKPQQPWTVLKLINWTRDYLAKVHLEDPRLSAEMLLAHVLGCRRIELYTRFDYELTPEQLAQFRELVQRARNCEPAAYLVGWREFYSLRFKVTPDVLVPRPETEALVTEAIAHLRSLGRPGSVWDVATGSGCVAIAVASQVRDAVALATDISPKAVEVAAQNAEAHGLTQRVTCAVADMLTLPAQWAGPRQFDVITSNPPYVADSQMIARTVEHEPAIALYGGPEGLNFLRRVATEAAAFLAPEGRLAVEFGYAQEDQVRDLLVATGSFREPRIIRDHQGIERIAVAARKPRD